MRGILQLVADGVLAPRSALNFDQVEVVEGRVELDHGVREALGIVSGIVASVVLDTTGGQGFRQEFGG